MTPAGSLLLLSLVVSSTPDTCAVCHPEARVQHDIGVHSAEGVTCTSCHGGNSEVTDVEAAHSGDYKGVPARTEVPELCGSCHSDVTRMRAYNLPTDQLALYRTSQHGQRLAEGDERVAICTDCHGVHEIRQRDDAASSVYVRNIPETCARCHSDTALMKQYGLGDSAYADYAAGVHGQALLEHGNTAAPECSRCHGAHGATPPGIGDVDKVCGQCHTTTRRYFLAGPHKLGMDRAGLPECASCHDNHRIERKSMAALGEVCIDCHDEGSTQIELSEKLQAVFAGAAEKIDQAGAMVAEAATIPLYVEDYQARLQEARTDLMESLPMVHALDATLIQDRTNRAGSIALEVESELRGKLDELRWQRVGLVIFWFYLLLTVAILLRARRRLKAELQQ